MMPSTIVVSILTHGDVPPDTLDLAKRQASEAIEVAEEFTLLSPDLIQSKGTRPKVSVEFKRMEVTERVAH